MQRADGGVASGLLLFASTPQSIRLAAYCQLPGRGAFLVRFTSLQIKPALKGEVDASVTSRLKGNDSKLPIYFTIPPQSRLRLDSSPINGGTFWCSANSYIKPALKGEVDASKASRRRG